MKKIRELIDQVGRPLPGNKVVASEAASINAPQYKYNDDARQSCTNPQADREAIESIEDIYFDASCDIISHELKKLPDNPEKQFIKSREKVLQTQRGAVSKKLSDVILENQPSYTKELKDVQELQKSLRNAFVICSNGRSFSKVSLHLTNKNSVVNHVDSFQKERTKYVASMSLGYVQSDPVVASLMCFIQGAKCLRLHKLLMSVYSHSCTASLSLLSNHQKRQTLLKLLDALQTIKTLQHTDVRLREMVEEEDYASAIQLCLECQEAAATYKHYHCIKDLSSKLQDTLEQIEEQIDVALSKTCRAFNSVLYAKLQMAYHLLGKTQSAMDQLLMHYTSSIHNTAFQVVLGFAELSSSGNNLQKKQYKDLCQQITNDIYIPCLMELCKALWEVMNCYHKTCTWHKEEFLNVVKGEESQEMADYVNRKLTHGHFRVWSDVQSRIRTYILSCDLSQFQYDDFITVLDIVKRFILVGEEFCSVKSDEDCQQQVTDNLNEPLRKQTLSYFHAHHRARLDELCMFVENESWQPCPVKSSFDVFGMQEFKFLKKSGLDYLDSSGILESDTSNACVSKYFLPFSEEGHPFADLEKLSQNPESRNADQQDHVSYAASDDEDDETADELLRDYVDERTGETPISSSSSLQSVHSTTVATQRGPILTNTALHVLRLCGSYMKMCDVLKPIAVDVVVCMSQLFDLYFYAVFDFFSSKEEHSRYKYERLNPTIQRIESSLFQPATNGPADTQEVTSDRNVTKVRKPMACTLVDLSSPETNRGITERIVATESLVCLAEQFQLLQKNLEEMIPAAKKAFLQQFYAQTVRSATDVRWPAYYDVCSHGVRYKDTVEKMSMVNWDLREIMSQHSPYVDHLLSELQLFKNSLMASARPMQIPPAVSRVIWEHCILFSNRVFVEGFSNAKKCSNEGRALMQLDYQQFLMKLEKLTNIRPIPNREFVEAYIKAYYLTESDLETWMQSHPEYSSKQLASLVSCSAASYSVASGNKKTKQKMLSLIDELTNRK